MKIYLLAACVYLTALPNTAWSQRVSALDSTTTRFTLVDTSAFSQLDAAGFNYASEHNDRALRWNGEAFAAQQDHRWEGLWIGAAAGGSLVGFIVHSMCSASDSDKSCFLPTVGGALMGATAGGVTGGLIGRALPKRGGP